jgi:hypothetical protein
MLLKTSVSDLDFENAFADIDARRLILIVDACQAGFIAADSGQRVGPFNTRGLAQLAYEKGMYILGAAQSYHAALEVARHQHGLLTYALIVEGLLEQAADFSPRDRDILDEEWLRFPLTRVPELQRESVQSSIARGQALSFSDEAAAGNSIEGIQVPSLYAPPARGSTPFKIEHLDQ